MILAFILRASKRMVLSESLSVKIKSSMYVSLTASDHYQQFSDQSSSSNHAPVNTAVAASIFRTKDIRVIPENVPTNLPMTYHLPLVIGRLVDYW